MTVKFLLQSGRVSVTLTSSNKRVHQSLTLNFPNKSHRKVGSIGSPNPHSKSRCEKVNPSKSLTQEIFLCTVRAAHKIGLFIYVSPLNIYGVLRESSDMSIPPSCNCNAAIEIIGRVPLSHSDPRRCSTAVPTCVV